MQDIPLSTDNLKLQRALIELGTIIGGHSPLLTLQLFLLFPSSASVQRPVLISDLRKALAPAAANTVFRAVALLEGNPPNRPGQKTLALVETARHPKFKTHRVAWLTPAGKKLRQKFAAA